MLSTSLTLATFFFFTLASHGLSFDHHHDWHRRSTSGFHHRHYDHSKKSISSWTLTHSYEGTNFFNEWTFFTEADPTNGQVTYLDRNESTGKKLAYVNSEGQAIIKVDNTTTLASGTSRNSVRITSNAVVGINSVVLIDATHMPWGCSVWPAFWMFGPDWPAGGEIDIVEGVNNNQYNQMTLHTSPGCTKANSTESGTVLYTNCDATVNYNSGCGVLDPSTTSYGSGFAAAGGGVFAMGWVTGGIRVWFWTREDIPEDIKAGVLDPGSWPEPRAYWPSSKCNPETYFNNLSIVFDITLCGDWAGASWPPTGCSQSTCSQVVEDPSNYNNAYFEINYVKVFVLE